MGGFDLGVDERLDARPEHAVVALDVELEVQAQAARVPVGGTDEAPRAVDHHELGVIEVPVGAPEIHFVQRGVLEQMGHRPVDEAEVALGGQHHIDLHAAPRGDAERGDERFVREEVGGDDGDPMTSAGEAAQHRPTRLVEVLVWTVRDRARGHVADVGDLREPELSVEVLARGEVPILSEDLQELLDHRPTKSKVDVGGGVLGRVGQDVVRAHVDPAREPHLSVDHQDLPVVPQIHIRPAPRGERRQET